MSNNDEKSAKDIPVQDHVVHMDNSLGSMSSRESKQPDTVEQTEDDSLVGSTIGGPPPDKHKRIPFGWQLWIIEFSCILISIGSIFAIIGVLQAYDQSSLPRLPFRITLNSYLAFLTTLAKAALMPPVAEALSQIKWNWFHVDRPLKDIQILDAASRGTFGSLLVLARMDYGVAAQLGALVIALGLFTSPITQQLIEYPTRMVPSPLEQASVSTIQQLQIPGSMISLPYSAMELAITAGLISSTPVEPIIPDCPTSNCTFPLFDSLGFCVRTANISDLLNVNVTYSYDTDPNDLSVSSNSSYQEAFVYNYTLPGTKDCYMITQSPYAFQACIQGSGRSLAFTNESDVASTSLFSIFYLFQAPFNRFGGAMEWNELSYHLAVEVLVQLCVQTFNVSVTKGTTASKIVSTKSEAVPKSYQHTRPVSMDCSIYNYHKRPHCDWNFGENNSYPLFLANPQKPDSELDQDLYGTTYDFLFNLAQIMVATIAGSFAWRPPNEFDAIGSQSYVNPLQTLMLGGDPVQEKQILETVESMHNNMATSLTNQIRTLESMNGTQNSFLVNGTAWEPETYVSIRWPWITFIVAQVVFGTACFVFTVWQSHRLGIPILKSSALAMLFALGEESRTPNGIESIGRVKEATSKIRVRLRDGELVRTDIEEE